MRSTRRPPAPDWPSNSRSVLSAREDFGSTLACSGNRDEGRSPSEYLRTKRLNQSSPGWRGSVKFAEPAMSAGAAFAHFLESLRGALRRHEFGTGRCGGSSAPSRSGGRGCLCIPARLQLFPLKAQQHDGSLRSGLKRSSGRRPRFYGRPRPEAAESMRRRARARRNRQHINDAAQSSPLGLWTFCRV